MSSPRTIVTVCTMAKPKKRAAVSALVVPGHWRNRRAKPSTNWTNGTIAATHNPPLGVVS